MDPAAGVAIMLSAHMTDKVIAEEHVGTRIVWVKLASPVCNIFFITVVHTSQRQEAKSNRTRHDRPTEETAIVNPKI